MQTDKCVYLVTEAIEPLGCHLSNFEADDEKKKQQKELFIAWGLFQITVSPQVKKPLSVFPYVRHFFQRALAFLNNDGNLQHNSVGTGSIFVNSAGEWKLGGLEYTGPPTLQNPLPVKILPGQEKYDPPEKMDSSKLRQASKWYERFLVIDMDTTFKCLMHIRFGIGHLICGD